MLPRVCKICLHGWPGTDCSVEVGLGHAGASATATDMSCVPVRLPIHTPRQGATKETVEEMVVFSLDTVRAFAGADELFTCRWLGYAGLGSALAHVWARARGPGRCTRLSAPRAVRSCWRSRWPGWCRWGVRRGVAGFCVRCVAAPGLPQRKWAAGHR